MVNNIYIKSERNKSKNEKNNIKNNFNFNNLNLLIGENLNKNKIYIPESGLYQNFLITGTIGSGKTSSAMYPFTKQFLKYNKNNKEKIPPRYWVMVFSLYRIVRWYA